MVTCDCGRPIVPVTRKTEEWLVQSLCNVDEINVLTSDEWLATVYARLSLNHWRCYPVWQVDLSICTANQDHKMHVMYDTKNESCAANTMD